jgi:hypothetical protein
MSIEDHPAYPTAQEVRQMLLDAADRCDRYSDDPEFAWLIVSSVAKEMWGIDAHRYRLIQAMTCQVPRSFPEVLSAAKVFTFAAQILNDRICAARQARNA